MRQDHVVSDPSRRRRHLQIEAFDVAGGRIVVIDGVLPVAAELDADGAPISTWTWSLDPGLRGRPTAKDVVVTTTHIVVASPAAGGLVRIDRVSGDVDLVPLEEDIGTLVRDGDRVWAVADPDREGAYEALFGSPDRRRVIWEEPSAGDMERFRGGVPGWFADSPAPDETWVPPSAPTPGAAGWQRDDDDESERIGPPTPLWLVEGERATRIEPGGELAALGAHEGMLVAVCRLPEDPLIKAVQPGGYVSYIRPATVLVGDGRSFTAVGAVADWSGEIAMDAQEAWLVGFNREHRFQVSEVRRLDLVSGTLSPPLRSDGQVVAVVQGRLVSLGWDRGHSGRPGRSVRIGDAAGDVSREMAIPEVDDTVVVDGAVVWFRAARGSALVAIDVETGGLRQVAVDVDCSELVAAVSVPDDLDPVAYESGELDGLRGAFFGGWRSESGEQRPFIRGVEFDSVDLQGSFPDTAAVALFHAAHRPGIRFGRRWPLYDDLGNPQPLEYADIHLMEDIEAAGYGLPPLENCVPDSDGIVWF